MFSRVRVKGMVAFGSAVGVARAFVGRYRAASAGERLQCRGLRGLSLFGSLLAMALLGTLVLGVVVWLEERSLEERARVAGSHVETLAHAVSSYVNSEFAALLGGTLPIEITRSHLSAVLPDGFAQRDALGRGSRVLVISAGSGALDVLVAQTLRAGDTLVPSAALLGERYGGVRMGVVAPEAPTELRGPTINKDVAGFQSAFAGVPAVGALAVFQRFDQESVCGSKLYRTENTGCPHANTMETDLEMGGQKIEDAGRIEAESFDVTNDIEAGGELIVTGALTVGEAVDVTGNVNVTGLVNAGRGAFSGTVTANSIAATDDMRTSTLMATGNITAASAGISRLIVGSCSGC